jgi:hypothetical protein
MFFASKRKSWPSRSHENRIDPGGMTEQSEDLQLGAVQVDFHDRQEKQEYHARIDEQGV